jgi:NTP pyrophosphatase (non-canonical NTP hydrolase)
MTTSMGLKSYQEKIIKQYYRFIKKFGISKSDHEKRGVELDFIRLTEELGEVARQISFLRTKRGEFNKKEFGDELTDVFFHICVLAYLTGVDLEQAIRRKLETNEKRLKKVKK